jgi:hypothetical protein
LSLSLNLQRIASIEGVIQFLIDQTVIIHLSAPILRIYLSFPLFVRLEKLFSDLVLDNFWLLTSLSFFQLHKLIAFFGQIYYSFLLSKMVAGFTLIFQISFIIRLVLIRESMIMAVLATSR